MKSLKKTNPIFAQETSPKSTRFFFIIQEKPNINFIEHYSLESNTLNITKMIAIISP